MLAFHQIRFAWEEGWLLDGVDASLAPGQVVWLSGENGSGKSTLLKLASGMVPHFHRGRRLEGEVRVLGRDMGAHPPKAFFPELAYLPSRNQPFYFLGDTLAEEVHLTQAMTGESPIFRSRKAFLNGACPQWQAGADRPLEALSEAERAWRLMVVLVLQGARLFLLDEPFRSASDALLRDWYRLLGVLAGDGCAVLTSSHVPVPRATTRWRLEAGRLTCD